MPTVLDRNSSTRRWRRGIIGALAAVALVVALRLWPPARLDVPEPGVLLSDVVIVNPGRGAVAHQTIRVRGSTIEAISAFSSPGEALPDAGRYAGSFVLPGLIDLHVHHPTRWLRTDVELFGLLHLLHGVTSVRDCGSIDGSVLETRARIAAGELAGPRIFACGPIVDGDPPSWPGAEIARNAAEGERIADRAAAAGVDCIKAYSNLSPEALHGLRTAATRHRLRLVGHVPTRVPFEQARIDDVQHLTGVPGGREAPEPGLIAQMLAGWDTIDAGRVDFVARTSLEQGISHTPTMVVVERLLELADYPALLEDPAARMLPRYYRELLWKPGALAGWRVPSLDSSTRARIRLSFCTVMRSLHREGVVLHVGSDSLNPFVVPGAALQEELGNFVECGFTPEQAWEAATRGNGESLAENGLGVLAAGAPADLLVFREDPTRDLAALASLQAVVTGGRLYPRAVLETAVARYRAYHAGWLQDRLSMLVMSLFSGSAEP